MIKLKPQVCFVLTTEFSVKVFLLAHLQALSEVYDVTVVTNTNNSNFLEDIGISAKIVPMNIARNINFFSDLKNLLVLIKVFNQMKFSCVHSVTPKAGLLAMLASWLVFVPMRVHIFTGQVWATKTGFNRFFLKRIDGLIASLTTHNLVDSPSQRQFLLDEKVTSCAKSRVFAKGSISGVDISRFRPDLEAKNAVRIKLNIADDEIIFLFIGRLTVDKGVLDLAQAFSRLNNEHIHLLYVGPDEKNIEFRIKQLQNYNSLNIHFVGHTDMPESYMAAADVLCLPSYREGFGTVLIEAAAVGVPAIASHIYGITDAVVDNQTGLLHEPGNINAITCCLDNIASNRTLRVKLGSQARERAIKYFDSHLITQAWVTFYKENLG